MCSPSAWVSFTNSVAANPPSSPPAIHLHCHVRRARAFDVQVPFSPHFAVKPPWANPGYKGAVAIAQLPYYLDEFTFRFNRRGSRARGLLFYRLLEHACQIPHTPTASLYRATGRGPSRRHRS